MLAPHEKAWGDGQALGCSGSAAPSCSLPLAHGARAGLRGCTGGFPAQVRFAGASEGREQCQGWLSSESKPPQSCAPQQDPGPISQWEIDSQFRQLGEVTLRLALSLSAALGSCPLLTFSWAKARDAVSKYSTPWSTPYRSRISMAEWDPRAGKKPHSSGRAVCIALSPSSLPCKISSQAHPELQRRGVPHQQSSHHLYRVPSSSLGV